MPPNLRVTAAAAASACVVGTIVDVTGSFWSAPPINLREDHQIVTALRVHKGVVAERSLA